MITMSRQRLYTPTTLCKICNKNKAIAKGMCGTCYKRNNYNKKVSGISYTQLKHRGERTWKSMQESYHICDDSMSVSAITKVVIVYTGTILLTTGIFLGYPRHCFFCEDTIHI